METCKIYYSYSNRDGGTLIRTHVWFRDNRYTCTDCEVFCGFDKIYSWWKTTNDPTVGSAPATPDQADQGYLGAALCLANLDWPEAVDEAKKAARQPRA